MIKWFFKDDPSIWMTNQTLRLSGRLLFWLFERSVAAKADKEHGKIVMRRARRIGRKT